MSISKHQKYENLIARCKTLEPTPCAVVHPCDESSLRGAMEVAKRGLLKPILVGPKARIEAVAAQFGIDIAGCELVDAPPHSVPGRDRGSPGARGQSRDADERQPAHRRTDGRRRQGRHWPAYRASHQLLLIMDVPAIDRVVVNTGNCASTSSRRCRTRCTSCRTPSTSAWPGSRRSPRAVAGQADILVVPDLEAGNMLAKSLSFMADADAAVSCWAHAGRSS